MIDVFCKSYSRNLHDIYILHQFSRGHNRTTKFSPNIHGIAYSSSFLPCRNLRELLTSVVFAVNKYHAGTNVSW